MECIYIDTLADQSTHQTQIAERAGDHHQAALVLGAGRRQLMRIGTGVKRLQCRIDLAVVHGLQQGDIRIERWRR